MNTYCIFRAILILTLYGLWTAMPVLAQPAMLPLAEGWKVQSSAKITGAGDALGALGFPTAGWYSTRVPKTVLAALVENGVYPDPFYGMNLKNIPGYKDGGWLVMPEGSPFRDPWWYRTEFNVAAEWKSRCVTLHFDGINYQANIWLNGQRIADSEAVKGMFRRFEFDVSGLLRYGEANALAVEIFPPGLIPDKDYDTKQIEATTGWDDHNPQPPDRNMGIWEDVYLRAQGPVTLRHGYVDSNLNVPSLDSAKLMVSAFLNNHSAEAVTGVLKGKIERVEFSKEVTLNPGETQEVVFTPDAFPQLVVAPPRVWWPHPVGPQELYTAELSFMLKDQVSDAQNVRFGIRKVETYINDEAWRGYKINGRNILIRGGAWMTSDMLMRFSERRYRAMVRYAREANLNMLRSEGFSIREAEEFYNACDEYGILVTQQIFGRSIPDEPLAIACTEDMMLRVRTHPSLAHFLGHDETFPTDNLDKSYKDLIAKHRANRTYQPHSGTFVTMFRNNTGGTRTGTRELWTYAGPSHYYHRKNDGAWGFAQSGGIGGVTAVRDSLREMMPEDQLWPALMSEAWSFHSVTQGGEYFDAILQAMNKSYGEAANFDDFCNKAYAMNYNSARGMFEAYGRNKYSATGITTWKYDTAWPASTSWQYIDWYLRPTGAYFGAKKACEPLHVQCAYDDEAVYVLNSVYEPVSDLEVSATVYNFDLSVKHTQKAVVAVEADGKTKAFKMEWPNDLSATYFLKLELRDTTGAVRSSNFYWLSTTPDIPGISGDNLKGVFYAKPKSRADFTLLNTLPPATLESTSSVETKGDEQVMTVALKNPGTSLAFLVQLAVTAGKGGHEIGPSFWEDNYFSMLPGEERTVKVSYAAKELAGNEPVVRVAGWNVK